MIFKMNHTFKFRNSGLFACEKAGNLVTTAGDQNENFLDFNIFSRNHGGENLKFNQRFFCMWIIVNIHVLVVMVGGGIV